MVIPCRDGIGVAKAEAGGGLRGLCDRVEALGGHLALASAATGTSVHARVPLPTGDNAYVRTSDRQDPPSTLDACARPVQDAIAERVLTTPTRSRPAQRKHPGTRACADGAPARRTSPERSGSDFAGVPGGSRRGS